MAHRRSLAKINGRIIDLAGKRFGRLLVLSYAGLDKNNSATWLCLCGCGTEKTITSQPLRTGLTRSCGCLKRELDKTHGMSICSDGKVPPEYDAYMHAKYRCTNPKAQRYKNYGGRGIKFLFTSFEQFFAELGPRPRGKTLDRPDNEGNYEPGNVRWATPKQQANNRRRAKK